MNNLAEQMTDKIDQPANQPCMLIIDDDPSLLTVLSRAIRRRGFEVVCAENGEQALSLCKEHQPTHISLDLKLAEETGLNLIPSLKLACPTSQVVMLTAYASIATAVDAIKLGATQYLCKPADADQLLNAFETQDTNSETVTPVAEVEEQTLSVKRLEWEHIQKVLNENDGNVSATARELGMHRRTLQRKLQKHPVKR